ICMVSAEALTKQLKIEELKQKLPQRPHSTLKQLVASEGAGARFLALQFMPAQKVIWISPKWNLYAPLLWKMAEEKQTYLVGLECAQRNRLRHLFKELAESGGFDGWILDGFNLKVAEGLFLEKLVRRLHLHIL